MDRVAAMRTFVRVAETGSFSSAARESATTQSAVSKQIAALEAHLGVRLVSRSTRALSLTEEGETYFAEARRLVADVEAVEARIRGGGTRLTGWLRVAASVGYGRRILMPRVLSFLKLHPDLRIDLRLSDGYTDLIEQGLDIAVRIGDLTDSGLVARKIGVSQRLLVASPSYFAALPEGERKLEHPLDLINHNCIVYTEAAARNDWEFLGADGKSIHVRVAGALQTNGSEVIHAAALSGLGVCHAPNWLVSEDLAAGRLEPLLPKWRGKPFPIHAVFPAHRKSVMKIDAFISHLAV